MSRAVAVLLLPLLAVLAGCGGDGAALILSGDYFPSASGTTWEYRLETRVETADASFSGSGTMTRAITRTQPVVVAGRTIPGYVASTTYSVTDLPGPDLPLTLAQRALVDLLFSASAGGLRAVEAYYGSELTPALGSTRHTLTALSLGGGPLLDVASRLPYLYNPPQAGEAHTASLPLIPMPLAPPFDRVGHPIVGTRLLDYADVDLPTGSGHAVYYFEQYAGNLHYSPTGSCAFSGRGRLLLLQGVGLAQGDWTTVYNLDGWVRVSVTLTGDTYTLPPP
ncbi:MAG: hypothetical protein HPY69_20325 [Armatimonadetes bacterium]|nr:hypothetical protein [Armatimonadota bacterium]